MKRSLVISYCGHGTPTFGYQESSYARGVRMGERRLGMIADWVLSEPNYSYLLTEPNLGIYLPN